MIYANAKMTTRPPFWGIKEAGLDTGKVVFIFLLVAEHCFSK